ncbi:MAG: hypothetical protein PHG04_04435, partial [Candidatus Nanoarchaeia archaeon]|nr:hypothetical protein [Candidatus Nanoarchaeia archaeon]
EIEKSKAYAIIDKDAFAKEISQMSKDELIQKLTELKTMGKYNNLKSERYTEAKNSLDKSIKSYKELKVEKLLDEKTELSERLNILEKFKEILKNLNIFNTAFIGEILEYKNFEDITNNEYNEKLNNCILLNEVSKVKYFYDLLNVLNQINDSRTKALEKELEDKVNPKISIIKELKKFADNKFFEEYTKLDGDYKGKIYDFKKLDDIKDAESFASKEKELLKSIERINQYLSGMKEVAKIVKEFYIK